VVAELPPSSFFPASRDDVEAILRALPAGTTDGLSCIRLEATTKIDPGEEVYPGIRVPALRGSYGLESNDIQVFAYARDSDTAISPSLAQELRFSMLRTLVHEVAHHVDRTTRVDRGRWRMDEVEKDERYAEEKAVTWCLEVVVPYLSERYGRG
jgi:hypothetical protein